MRKKTNLFTLLFFCVALLAKAQEVKVPLLNNPYLPSEKKQALESKALNKTGDNFPIVDYFTDNQRIDTNFWQAGNCSVLNRKLIFNVLDSLQNVYPSGEVQDRLISYPMVLPAGNSNFISFSFELGSSYSPDDSLILYGLDNFGEWKKLWQNPISDNQDIRIDLSASELLNNQFAIKFELFSQNLSASNSNVFSISKLVIASKLNPGWYDHLRTPHVPDSVPDHYFFSGSDIQVIKGIIEDYAYGNLAKLDVLDVQKKVYNNASNLYSGTDTLYLHPMDVLAQASSDSLFFSFLLKPKQINVAQDSLILEFRNNLGQWVRALALGGLGLNQFSSYTFPINFGRFRHANFQARFIFKSNCSIGNDACWFLSGFKMIRKIPLPFFDDFSNARIQVNRDHWINNNVFVNNDFPVLHPSVNVATFDGLDENGNAYSKFAIKGIADVLTTQSMNLKGLKASDSLIFSMYYQYEPQGTTNQVFTDDSLIIEMRNSAFEKDSFEVVKMISAHDSLLNKFTLFQFALTKSEFFHEDFQIRIKNRGSLSGNLSHWHIDYIQFNKGRKLFDTNKDMALSNTPPIMLGPYTSMPWSHYIADKSKYANLPDKLRLVNHDNQNYAVDYFRTIMKPEGDTLDKFNNILPTIEAQNDSTVTIDRKVVFSSSMVADSLVFNSRYRIKISGNQNDNVTSNDTFSVPTIFSNYYAYDDGTAEGGYGIFDKTNSGACLKYTIPVPDSLVGVYIYFNQSEKDVSTQRFNLKVWKQISTLFEPATNDVVLYNQEISKPLYTNKLNGFASIKFTQPIAIKDSFYIGWEQTSAFVLNIGLDKNYRFGLNPNMAFKADGRWYPAEIPGALMIRPIFNKFLGVPTGISTNDIANGNEIDFSVYPNPTRNEINCTLQDIENYEISLFEISGLRVSKLHSNNQQITLPEVAEGLYFLVFEHAETHRKFVKKIIIKP